MAKWNGWVMRILILWWVQLAKGERITHFRVLSGEIALLLHFQPILKFYKVQVQVQVQKVVIYAKSWIIRVWFLVQFTRSMLIA